MNSLFDKESQPEGAHLHRPMAVAVEPVRIVGPNDVCFRRKLCDDWLRVDDCSSVLNCESIPRKPACTGGTDDNCRCAESATGACEGVQGCP